MFFVFDGCAQHSNRLICGAFCSNDLRCILVQNLDLSRIWTAALLAVQQLWSSSLGYLFLQSKRGKASLPLVALGICGISHKIPPVLHSGRSGLESRRSLPTSYLCDERALHHVWTVCVTANTQRDKRGISRASQLMPLKYRNLLSVSSQS